MAKQINHWHEWRTKQGRAGHGRIKHRRAGQGRAGQDKARQGRAGQSKAGQGRTGQGNQNGNDENEIYARKAMQAYI